MNDFVNLIDDFFTNVFNFKIFLGIAAAVLTFIAEIIYINKHPKINKKVKKAEELGNVVTATRISMWDEDPTGISVTSWIYATYVYEVEGKKYKYKYLERQPPPMTIKLYYLDNPKKAFPDKIKRNSLLYLLFYLLPAAAAVITINLLGGVD